jgi:hypothetical protein
MLSEKIAKLVIDQVYFTDDELEVLVEAQNEAYGDLHRAGLVFETAAGADGESLEKVADGIVTLGSTFGVFYEELTPEQVDKVIAAFADIFTAPNADQEAAGEALFNAVIGFIARTKNLNFYVDKLLNPV